MYDLCSKVKKPYLNPNLKCKENFNFFLDNNKVLTPLSVVTCIVKKFW